MLWFSARCPPPISYPSRWCDATIQLGVCTAEGSSGLAAIEHVRQFFADPSTHCVGYGDRLTKAEASAGASTDSVGTGASAADAEAMPKIQEDLTSIGDAGQAGTEAAHEALGPEMARETEFGSSSPLPCPELLVREIKARCEYIAAELHSSRICIWSVVVPTRLGGWANSVGFGAKSRECSFIVRFEVDTWRGTVKQFLPLAALDSHLYLEQTIQVETLEVLHPKQGAVYWEGPVNVSLTVTLGGESVWNAIFRL